MTQARRLLLMTGVVWTCHSLWILVDPDALSYVGVDITHLSTRIEIMATFGLFTASFGIFSLLAVASPERYQHAAVVLWSLLYPAAAIGRLLALARYGGTFALGSGEPESIHAAMLFVVEIPFSIAYLLALRASDSSATARAEAPRKDGIAVRYARALLFVTGLIWIGHAGWIAIDPRGMEYTGYVIRSWPMTVHVATFYGTFETLLGVFGVLAAIRPARLLGPSMVLWTMIYTALAGGRILGILRYGGTFEFGDVHTMPDTYNAAAMWCLEGPSAVLFAVALVLTWNRVTDANDVEPLPAAPASLG